MSFHLPHLSFLLQNGETRCLFHQEKIKMENKCDKTLEFWHITTQMLGQVGAGWRLRRSQSSNCRIQELLSCNSIIILKSLQKSFLKKKKKLFQSMKEKILSEGERQILASKPLSWLIKKQSMNIWVFNIASSRTGSRWCSIRLISVLPRWSTSN